MNDIHELDLSSATWRKSSASGAEHDCVEVAELPPPAMAVRDSKDPFRKALRFTAPAWRTFCDGVLSGKL
jgi:hypothetical protein